MKLNKRRLFNGLSCVSVAVPDLVHLLPDLCVLLPLVVVALAGLIRGAVVAVGVRGHEVILGGCSRGRRRGDIGGTVRSQRGAHAVVVGHGEGLQADGLAICFEMVCRTVAKRQIGKTNAPAGVVECSRGIFLKSENKRLENVTQLS